MTQPFDRAMVANHLDTRKIEYDIDDDGDFRFGLSLNETDEVGMVVFLSAEGPNEDMLAVRSIGMSVIPQEACMQVVLACNQWNGERRYPKAALVIVPIEGAPEGTPQQAGQVHLSCYFPLGAGATQPLVDDFISETIGSAMQFWAWLPEHLQQMAQQADASSAGGQGDPSLN
jgi:hypothetical protein